MVKTNPELLPPRREATPSGTPTSISTRQAAGKAKRLCISIRNRFASGSARGCARTALMRHRVEGRVQAAQVHVALLAQHQRHIGGGKRGDVGLFRLVGHGLVAHAVAQPHEQLLRVVVDHGGRGGGGDQRIGGIGDVGHEHLAPVGRAGSRAHVLHIENEVAKLLVEDARLNLVARPAKSPATAPSRGWPGWRVARDKASCPAPAACPRSATMEATRTK